MDIFCDSGITQKMVEKVINATEDPDQKIHSKTTTALVINL